MSNKVLSTFEPVIFPEFSKKKVPAKIDTGAYTGALHCSSILEHDKEGGKVLQFTPYGSRKSYIKDEFLAKYVKSSNGKRQKRYFITTSIVVQGKKYEIMMSLANRSEMKWPVLIGRRFLRKYHFLVDPSLSNGYREQIKKVGSV